ncbi:hypothetical protein CCOS01_06125 [Colletotrichum costaricense]|uniref:Uncharacterized protein n=1 Tax=Colletotrichum costaricense TaxID=1209916 RepID=A0AAI9Z320_9PEZI|nr:hypothetical protein CCOS01_06125 [Colletotrichum costaricense]
MHTRSTEHPLAVKPNRATLNQTNH